MNKGTTSARAVCVFALLGLSALAPAIAQNPFAAQVEAAAKGRALLTDDDLHVILCGTAGPLVAPERVGPCTAVIADGRFFVVDAGAGAVGSMGGMNLPVGDLTAALITHFHSDHMAEIGELNFAHWTLGDGTKPLRVIGPEGMEEVVAGFNQAYRLDLGYRVAHHGDDVVPERGARAQAETVRFAGGKESAVVYDQDGFRVIAFLVDHPPIVPSVGYRFDYGGRSVVVSGDTKRSPNLIAISKEADLLVHEAFADTVVNMVAPMLEQSGRARGAQILKDALDNHTFPPDVYALAAEANVKTLVLYHLVPALPPAEAQGAFGRGSDAFTGQHYVGEDGMHFVLPKGSDEVRLDRISEL